MHINELHYVSRQCVPIQAEAKSVKPMARGAMLPCPGFVTAVAYTTWAHPWNDNHILELSLVLMCTSRKIRYLTMTRKNVMMVSHHQSWAVVVCMPLRCVKHPGMPAPPPTATSGSSPDCTSPPQKDCSAQLTRAGQLGVQVRLPSPQSRPQKCRQGAEQACTTCHAPRTCVR